MVVVDVRWLYAVALLNAGRVPPLGWRMFRIHWLSLFVRSHFTFSLNLLLMREVGRFNMNVRVLYQEI